MLDPCARWVAVRAGARPVTIGPSVAAVVTIAPRARPGSRGEGDEPYPARGRRARGGRPQRVGARPGPRPGLHPPRRPGLRARPEPAALDARAGRRTAALGAAGRGRRAAHRPGSRMGVAERRARGRTGAARQRRRTPAARGGRRRRAASRWSSRCGRRTSRSGCCSGHWSLLLAVGGAALGARGRRRGPPRGAPSRCPLAAVGRARVADPDRRAARARRDRSGRAVVRHRLARASGRGPRRRGACCSCPGWCRRCCTRPPSGAAGADVFALRPEGPWGALVTALGTGGRVERRRRARAAARRCSPRSPPSCSSVSRWPGAGPWSRVLGRPVAITLAAAAALGMLVALLGSWDLTRPVDAAGSSRRCPGEGWSATVRSGWLPGSSCSAVASALGARQRRTGARPSHGRPGAAPGRARGCAARPDRGAARPRVGRAGQAVVGRLPRRLAAGARAARRRPGRGRRGEPAVVDVPALLVERGTYGARPRAPSDAAHGGDRHLPGRAAQRRARGGPRRRSAVGPDRRRRPHRHRPRPGAARGGGGLGARRRRRDPRRPARGRARSCSTVPTSTSTASRTRSRRPPRRGCSSCSSPTAPPSCSCCSRQAARGPADDGVTTRTTALRRMRTPRLLAGRVR